MKIPSVYTVMFLFQTQHLRSSVGTTASNEVLDDQIQSPLVVNTHSIDTHTKLLTTLPTRLLFHNNKLLHTVQGLHLGGNDTTVAVDDHQKARVERLFRKIRAASESTLKKSKKRRGKGKHRHSKERRKKHSRERHSRRRHKKPKRKKGSRERTDVYGPTTPDWSTWIDLRGLSDHLTAGYGNSHIPAYVPHGSGIPSFVPGNPVPPYAPSIPGHFPGNHHYYPSYIPGFGGAGAPYNPGWEQPPLPTSTTSSTTRRPYRRTRRPTYPRRTTPFILPRPPRTTTYRPPPSTEAPVVITPTELPDEWSMRTYISEVFTATVPVIATFANGDPITANVDAETIPPLLRINRSDQ